MQSYNQELTLATLLNTYYEQYLASGEYDEAIALYCELLGYQPDVQGYHELGVYLAEQEEWHDAIACFLHSIQLDPDFFEGYYNLGVCLQQLQQYTAAIQVYQQAVHLQPDTHAYVCLGSCLSADHRPDEAIAALIQATQVDPYSPLPYKQLGDLLTQQGRSAETAICYLMHLPFSLLQSWQPPHPSLWLHPTLDVAAAKMAICYPAADSAITEQLALGTHGDRLKVDTVLDIPQGQSLCYEADVNIIATGTGQIIPAVSWANGNWLNYWPHLPPVQAIDARVVHLSAITGSVFFHWMFDVLPKLGLLTQAGIDWNTIDYFVVTALDRPFQRETLSLLQIPAHKLLANSDYPYITARQLLVPYLASRITPDSCRFLRQQFLPHAMAAAIGPSPPTRLYITRRAAATRKIVNEADVVAYLETLGFCTIELESMPFQEQVALMAQATAVVAVHGSGLTNIVFCNPGTCVVELLSQNYLTPYYSFISKQVGLRYFCLLGENPEQREPGDYTDLSYMWEDIIIDLSALKNLLNFAGLA